MPLTPVSETAATDTINEMEPERQRNFRNFRLFPERNPASIKFIIYDNLFHQKNPSIFISGPEYAQNCPQHLDGILGAEDVGRFFLLVRE